MVGTLELSGVPYTGCRPWATARSATGSTWPTPCWPRRESPVPRFALARKNLPQVELDLPVIVKPAAEDASLGVDNGAVCTTRKDLKRRIALMSEQFETVLVQEYVAGREFNVGFRRPDPAADLRDPVRRHAGRHTGRS